METIINTTIAGVFALASGFIAVKYRKGLPKKVDRVELLFTRYDADYKELKERLDDVEKKNKNLSEKLDKAIQSIEDKDTKIKELQRKVRDESLKYQRLLKRFNALKLKYEKGVSDGV